MVLELNRSASALCDVQLNRDETLVPLTSTVGGRRDSRRSGARRDALISVGGHDETTGPLPDHKCYYL